MTRYFRGLVVIALGFVAVPCWALSKDWNDGTDNWSNGAAWTPAGVPGAGETVNIVFADDVARTVTYDYTGPAIALGVLNVDMSGAGTNAITLSMAANALTTSGEQIGPNGRGTFTQSGGTHTINLNDLNLGNNNSGNGTYNLSGSGALVANFNETVGFNGIGNFNQSGGTNTISGAGHELYLGRGAGTGTYALTGGSLSAGEHEYVGYAAIGNFDHSAGTNTVAGTLDIGALAGATGAYLLSGTGQLTANQITVGDLGAGTFSQIGTSVVSTPYLELAVSSTTTGGYALSAGTLTPSTLRVGVNGTGTFTQNGGNNNPTTLHIGYASSALGTYSLSSGTLDVAGSEFVGVAATGGGGQSGGTFTQSGNSIHRMNALSIGNNVGSTGSMSLSTGTLVSSVAEFIGNNGTGTLVQASGVHTSLGDINIAAGGGSTGTYSLNGGTANAANVFVGGQSSGAGGVGVLTVSGSTTVLSVPGAIKVYNTLGSFLNLQGGTLNVGAINTGGVSSLFNWSSGTLNITNDVAWDPGAAANSTSVIFGSSLSLSSGRTLKVTGNETIGGNGAFNLTQLSGNTHTVTGNITLKTGSTLTVNSGSTLNYSSFTQAGGTITGSTFRNATSFTYQSGTIQAQFVNAGTVSFGSSWTIGGTFQNESAITVSGGQTLSATSTITNLGSFTVNGGTIGSGGSITNSIGGTLTAHGTISPTITNHGTMIVDGVLSIGGTLSNDGVLQGAGTISQTTTFTNLAGGTINAMNPGSTLAITNVSSNAGSFVNIGPTSTFSVTNSWINSGNVNLQGAGARLSGGVVTNNGLIQGFGTITSTLATSNTGVFRASGGELDFAGLGVINSSQSQFQALPGSTLMFLQGMSSNSGTISLVGGTFDNNNRTLQNSGTINGYGTIRTSGLTNNSGRLISVGEGNMDILGSVTNNGIFSIQTGRSAYFFGAVSGSGSFTGTGTAVFLASLSPGNSPAQVNFAGGATLGGGTALNMELGGNTVGNGYDKIDVEGQLSIGGVLTVSLINGFVPAAWSSFDLLDWGSLAGTFSSISLPTLPVGQWDTSKLYVDGTLSVSLSGDFDHNGAVNAADYVVWRKGLGTIYSQSDYDAWRAHYGEGGSGSGSTVSGAAVPEPGTVALALTLVVAGMLRRASSGPRSTRKKHHGAEHC